MRSASLVPLLALAACAGEPVAPVAPPPPAAANPVASSAPATPPTSGVRYPAVMGVAGWNDPRVAPWEPGKFVAALPSAPPRQ